MKEEFERRLQAAVRGDVPEKPTPLDTSLRALVEQLQGGPPAPSTGPQRMVRSELPRREREA
jgi:hypothetical protein